MILTGCVSLYSVPPDPRPTPAPTAAISICLVLYQKRRYALCPCVSPLRGAVTQLVDLDGDATCDASRPETSLVYYRPRYPTLNTESLACILVVCPEWRLNRVSAVVQHTRPCPPLSFRESLASKENVAGLFNLLYILSMFMARNCDVIVVNAKG